jgi:GTP cyclohydrolase I
MTVRLPSDRRGTHMSRMVEIARDHLAQVDPRRLPIILKTALHHLEAPAVEVRLSLPFATEIAAPASRARAWQVHELVLRGRLDPDNVEVETSVMTEVTSLCPCSKAISDYGAHNQRSQVTLSIFSDADDPYPFSVADIVELIRGVGSAPVFPLVKRSDERVITMQAYDHPAFVEDMVRDVSLACRSRSLAHRVSIRSIESIHSHDALAIVEWAEPAT